MGDLAVITTVSGRHDHLVNQRRGLRQGLRPPDRHIVVSMGDPAVRPLVAGESECTVLDLDVAPPWPLAHCRNIGADYALQQGADLLVFLDVDCVPSRTLVQRYEAVAAKGSPALALLCGQVSYLPPQVPGTLDPARLAAEGEPHPDRPLVPAGAITRGGDHRLFWSLSFAVSAATWSRIGGFCESYLGYGAEDTDFGQCARQAGVDLVWVGGADAYHQHHPVSDPPTEHLDEILSNARTFRRRWGWWPMEGWLRAFEQSGLVRFDEHAATWVRA